MDSPQSYHYLVALVHKLADKIDGLERKIDRLVGQGTGQGMGPGQGGNFPAVPPPVAFLDWVDSFVVSSTNLEVICQQHILEGFKHCLLENCRQGTAPPLFVKGRSRQLYVFEVFPGCDDETEAQWQPFTDDHLDHLIQEVWRKILERFLGDTELFAEEDERVQNYRDMCMKKILEMRKLLAQRHRKEITRCLATTSRDKNIL
jgi:hypothetical protein